jgi:hypothetical protein
MNGRLDGRVNAKTALWIAYSKKKIDKKARCNTSYVFMAFYTHHSVF